VPEIAMILEEFAESRTLGQWITLSQAQTSALSAKAMH
jgi:hypothetical protein